MNFYRLFDVPTLSQWWIKRPFPSSGKYRQYACRLFYSQRAQMFAIPEVYWGINRMGVPVINVQERSFMYFKCYGGKLGLWRGSCRSCILDFS